MLSLFNKLSKTIVSSTFSRSFVGISLDPHYDFKSIIDNPQLYKDNLKNRYILFIFLTFDIEFLFSQLEIELVILTPLSRYTHNMDNLLGNLMI